MVGPDNYSRMSLNQLARPGLLVVVVPNVRFAPNHYDLNRTRYALRHTWKGSPFGDRQRAHTRKLYDAGLLSAGGLRKVQDFKR